MVGAPVPLIYCFYFLDPPYLADRKKLCPVYKAEITISAYEAFVAGSRLEDGTELELDLNKVKGFPEGFYWKA